MKNIYFVLILVAFAIAGFFGEHYHPGNYIWAFSAVCLVLAAVIAVQGFISKTNG